jgi:hypothetical protein
VAHKRVMRSIFTHGHEDITITEIYLHVSMGAHGLGVPKNKCQVIIACIEYKMALALLYACNNNTAKPHLSAAPEPGSIFHGYTGTLIPALQFFSVSSHIKRGDQATQK